MVASMGVKKEHLQLNTLESGSNVNTLVKSRIIKNRQSIDTNASPKARNKGLSKEKVSSKAQT